MEHQEASTQERLTRYEADVIKSAEQNHIWLNAFECIRPSAEFKIQLAEQVLRMLNTPGCLIPSDFDGGSLESLGAKELVVRINKS